MQFLLPKGQSIPIGLSLRPDDPLAKKNLSRETTVQNALLRITIPRRTGRKRKRGSDEPYEYYSDDQQAEHQGPLDGKQLLQRLRDNEAKYKVQPVGLIREAHRFRSLPDFQMKTRDHSIMNGVANHLLNPSCSTIKNFDLDVSAGFPENSGIIAPPTFIHYPQPMNYIYQQNPAISVIVDESGNKTTFNSQAPRKRLIVAVPADIEEVPKSPPPGLPPLTGLGQKYLKKAVDNLETLLEKRPIVTRRVAMNSADWSSESMFKDATQYVGYSFKSGPWKDALVQYGIDPRKDPKYRFYQTLAFQLTSKDKINEEQRKLPSGKNKWLRSERHRKDQEPSHIFDGKSITTNGKTWQLCDITDPLLHDILHTENIQPECDVHTWGWFRNGTLSKTRVIMRDKIGEMLKGESPNEEAYKKIATIPDDINMETMAGCLFDAREVSEKVLQLASEVRGMAKFSMTARAKGGSVQPGYGSRRSAYSAISADEKGQEQSSQGAKEEGEDEDEEYEGSDFDAEGDKLDASEDEQGEEEESDGD